MSVLLLWGAANLPLQAQILRPREDKWEASFFLGFASIGDREFVTPVADGSAPGQVGLSYASGVQAGLRIGENFGRYFTAEMEYSFANAPLTFRNLTPDLPTLGVDHSVHSILYGVAISPMKRSARIRPYGAISAGAAYYQVSAGSETQALLQGVDLRDRWQFAASLGGGVKLRVGDRAGFRFDVRNQITAVPSYSLPSVAPVSEDGSIGAALRPTGNLNNWQYNIGFFYVWGR